MAIADSTSLSTGGPYDGKSMVISFETGSDVTSRQVLYEQGGNLRGLNAYIDNGTLHIGDGTSRRRPGVPALSAGR
ncbi:MAG: hypothetical protein O3A84_16060 [Proteobacteria bacterium]|nr:hypothetical protein [Pseudomonadota bacterium]